MFNCRGAMAVTIKRRMVANNNFLPLVFILKLLPYAFLSILSESEGDLNEGIT
jgi:hypothetical protein